MKKSILIAVVVYCVVCVVVFSACCKKKCNDVSNPECGNYNPCLAKKVTADFNIYERSFYANIDSLWLTDTTVGWDVVFEPKFKNATSYTWKIGAGTYAKQKLSLSFNSAKDSAIIPITLTVHKKPDLDCYPQDDSIITFTKNLVIDRTNNKYYGKWEGYYTDSPKVKSVIDIRQATHPWYFLDELKGSASAFGLYPGCDTIINKLGDSRYRYILDMRTDYMTSSGYVIQGTMIVDAATGNNITMDYEYIKSFTDKGTRKFVGTRIK
jgi:hypothetical protein